MKQHLNTISLDLPLSPNKVPFSIVCHCCQLILFFSSYWCLSWQNKSAQADKSCVPYTCTTTHLHCILVDCRL